MKILQIKNNIVVNTNNVILENDIIPTSLIQEGWVVLHENVIAQNPLYIYKEDGYENKEDKWYVKYKIISIEDDNDFNLNTFKQQRLFNISKESYSNKEILISPSRIQNIKDGFTGYNFTLADNGATIGAFRDEYYRLESLVNACTSIEEINAIVPNWPTEIVKAT